MRLDGKVALITGVSQYMGRAVTKVFTDAGAIVCVQDRKRADAEQHAAYARKNGELGLILEADLTRPADVDALFRTIDEKFGRIDVLVSNHSIVKSIPLDEVDDAAVEEMFNENFFSFCRVTPRRRQAHEEAAQREDRSYHFAGGYHWCGHDAHAGCRCIADCLSVSLRSFPWRTEFLD